MNNIKTVQVLGSGCSTCKSLHELTKQAVAELGLKLEVEYITDIQKIIELGVMSSPVLTVDGQVVSVGQVPGLEKIKELLTESGTSSQTADKNNSDCCCGGSC